MFGAHETRHIEENEKLCKPLTIFFLFPGLAGSNLNITMPSSFCHIKYSLVNLQYAIN